MNARGWGVAALAMLAAGCWPQAAGGPDRTAYNGLETTVTAANVADLDLAWAQPLASRANEPVVDGGRVFVRSGTPSGTGAVTAFDLATGEQQWSVAASNSGRPFTGAGVPAIRDGEVYVPVDQPYACALARLDAATGAEQVYSDYRPDLTVARGSGTCQAGDVVITDQTFLVPTYVDYTLVGCGFPSPTPLSSFARGPVLRAGVASGPSPWIAQHTQGGCSVPPPVPPERFGSVSLGGDVVAVPWGTQVEVYSLAACIASSPGSCSAAWSVDVGGPTVGAAVLGNGDLAVTRSDGTVAVVDVTTQAVEWTGAVGGVGLAASPTTLFSAAADGTIAAYPIDGCGAATCDPTWTATLTGPASTRPSIGGDVVYVGGADGVVTALPANGCGGTTCGPLWSHDTGDSPITGAPAISSGTVVVGAADGTVSAFRLAPEG